MEIKGTVKDIIYQNDDNSYVVAKMDCDGEIVTIVGSIAHIFQGQILRVCGDVIKHPSFGEQIRIDTVEEIQPSTEKGIEKYLASGVINGIGPATAKRIVKMFGKDVFEIMDFNIDELLKVEGIGEKKLKIIKESYTESREVRNILIFLQGYGVTPKQCIKIYQRYGGNSIDVVKSNPYILCDEVQGFGFKTADKIAMNMGIEKNSEFRMESGIKYIMGSYSSFGHTCIPLENLIEDASTTLEVESDEILESVKNLIMNQALVQENMDNRTFIFTQSFHHYEMSCAEKIIELSGTAHSKIKLNISEFIKDFEKRNGINFHENQKLAIEGIKDTGFEIITGGPGTGKTTIIKCILELLKKADLKVLMAAPTGRAAKRMSETTGEESRTIHRLLDLVVSEDDEEFLEEAEDGSLDCDCIIVDEASMVDVMLMSSLLKSIKMGTRIILVGDVDQLPSVGAGRVLGDLIDSEFVKVIKLSHIYRQGSQSMITENAHRINRGEIPLMNTKGSDFFYMGGGKDNPANIDTIVNLISTRLPAYNKSWDPKKDIQILSPMRKGDLGIDNLNTVIRSVLNKDAKRYKFTDFSVGDKVMQVKNNYSLKSRKSLKKDDFTFEEETGVFNGDIGFVADVDEENQTVTVIFDEERYVDYTPLELDELEFAYAITIHKSQGSEFKVVIIPLFMGPPLLMNRNLIYTAVTRAKQLLVLVGNMNALYYMVRNDRSYERYTSLGYKLKQFKPGN